VGTTLRTAVGGALIALVAAPLATTPAPADAATQPHIVVRMPTPATLDPTSPTDTIYPARDTYGDTVSIYLSWPARDGQLASGTVTIRNRRGRVVLHRSIQEDEGTIHTSWNGRRGGEMLPEGRYRITGNVVSELGETRDFPVFRIRLSHARRTWVTMRRTVSPAASLVDADVRRCSHLKRPARAGWPGSLGYRSRSHCRRSRTVVSTIHGIWVPRTRFAYGYKTLRVTVVGGRPAGARRSYLVLANLTHFGDWTLPVTFDGRMGKHRGPAVEHGVAVIGGGQNGDFGRPHTIWTVGLANGASFDVRKFIVTLRYAALR
jgi:hypothetical protein